MKRLEERLREQLRLTILQLIGALERRRIDDATLSLALRDLGHETERSVLISELRQLERQGLLKVEELGEGRLLVLLTERGDLTRRGLIEEPGVARPALP